MCNSRLARAFQMFGFGAHSVTYTPHRYKTLKTFAHKPNRTNFLILRSLKSFNKMQRHLITFIQIHVRAHSIAFRCVFSGKFLHHIRFFSSYFTCTQAIHVLPSFRFEVFNGKSNLKKKKKKKGNFEVEKNATMMTMMKIQRKPKMKSEKDTKLNGTEIYDK